MWLPDTTVERLRRAAAFPDLSGTRYRIVEELGRGGMGAVYLAEDSGLRRQVALKVLSDPAAWSDSAARLEAEARILAGLEHPGIVPVHDVGTLSDGRVFYTMKLVRGRRLDHLRDEQPPLSESLRVFLRICEAVAFAHSRGVIHRDLKPENIMTGAFGEVLVMDWGVAKVLGENTGVRRSEPGAGLTADGTVVGTRGYMAPEQARGESGTAGVPADVYSLGAILRFLLEGREPSRRLLSVCRKAMAELPGERYASAKDLGQDVEAYLDGLPVAAHPENWIERAARVAVRHRTAILLIAAYLAMRALLLFFANG